MAEEAHHVLCDLAARRGFDLVGVTSAEPLPDAQDALSAWWHAGHAADLAWMGRDPKRRSEPRALLPNARSVVVVAVPYGVPERSFAAAGRYGRVARYAWGRDYHDVLIPRLRDLARDVQAHFGSTGRSKAASDHSPLMERALAVRSGLGFFGKNTCLLLPRGGSYVLLGELLVDVELPPTPPPAVEHCGSCRACLDACPTQAFPAPFVLDARRCVSYLTIEHRGVVPRELRAGIGAWVFGCDVCQEVCPFNRFASDAGWPELEADAGAGGRLDLAEVLSLDTEEAFRSRFGGTPLLRPKRAGLLRNAAIVARNVSAEVAVPALRARVAEDEDPLVRAHALWALFGLDASATRALADRLRTIDPDATVRAEAEAGLAETS